MTGRALRRTKLGRVLLAVWGVSALVGSAYLLGSHLAALPTPSVVDARLAGQMQAFAAEHPAARDALMMHVLYTSCRCSQRVAEHLLARGPHEGDRELVLVVDAEAEPVAEAATGLQTQLVAAGFEVRTLDSAALHDQYGIEAAPLLVVADPAGHVRYVGGYGDRKQTPVLRDVEIGDRVARGETVSPLPLFGCAVSASLRSSVDPFGVLR